MGITGAGLLPWPPASEYSVSLCLVLAKAGRGAGLRAGQAGGDRIVETGGNRGREDPGNEEGEEGKLLKHGDIHP